MRKYAMITNIIFFGLDVRRQLLSWIGDFLSDRSMYDQTALLQTGQQLHV